MGGCGGGAGGQGAGGGTGGGGDAGKVLQLTNKERKAAGVGELCLNSKLMKAAQAHSDDMLSCDTLSHTSCDGRTMSDRFTSAGYQGTGASAENVAKGQTTAESVMQSWMKSAGHKKNILRDGVEHMGIAKSSSGNYWTQVFGKGDPSGCDGGGGGGGGGQNGSGGNQKPGKEGNAHGAAQQATQKMQNKGGKQQQVKNMMKFEKPHKPDGTKGNMFGTMKTLNHQKGGKKQHVKNMMKFAQPHKVDGTKGNVFGTMKTLKHQKGPDGGAHMKPKRARRREQAKEPPCSDVNQDTRTSLFGER